MRRRSQLGGEGDVGASNWPRRNPAQYSRSTTEFGTTNAKLPPVLR